MASSETTKMETIVNPVTGDLMTFVQPSYQHQGQYAKIRFDLPPGAKESPLHYHTKMDETFTVKRSGAKRQPPQTASRREPTGARRNAP